MALINSKKKFSDWNYYCKENHIKNINSIKKFRLYLEYEKN